MTPDRAFRTYRIGNNELERDAEKSISQMFSEGWRIKSMVCPDKYILMVYFEK